MGVEFLIRDKLSESLVLWSFKVDRFGFVHVYIEGIFTDTLYALGKIDSFEILTDKVTAQLSEWQVEWHSFSKTS